MKRYQIRLVRLAITAIGVFVGLASDTFTQEADNVNESQARADAALSGRARFYQRFANNPMFATPRLNYTTFGNPANYVAAPGTGSDGVVAVLVTVGGSTSICTGTLLPTRRHVLTAAHCISDDNGDLLVGAAVEARFNLAGGQQTVAGTTLHVPVEFDGDSGNGFDVGVIRLANLAPSTETREIYRGTAEIGVASERVGYGRSGTGTQGHTIAPAHNVKRLGQNRQEVLGEALGVGIAAGTQFIYDFDDGTTAHEALAALGLITNTGLGTPEVCGAGGDSGSPTLINGQIAGVHSWGLGFSNVPGTPDVTPGVTDASFGEIASDMRMSRYALWYDQVVPPVVSIVFAFRARSSEQRRQLL